MSLLNLFYKNWHVILSTTFHEIKSKYTGTIFGLSWAVIYPLLFLGLYSVIYTYVFKVRVADSSSFEYILMIFSGLIPFLGFSEALGQGVSSVSSNKNLIKNTLYPIELISIKTVLSSSITLVVGLCLLMLCLIGCQLIKPTAIYVPLILFLQIIFTIGLIWILSAVNVFVPDLSHMISIIILFLMLVSPIAYTQEMIPPKLMFIMYPNPLYYMIMLYRGALIQGSLPSHLLLIFTGLSFSMFWGGYFFFSRLKRVFVDYV